MLPIISKKSRLKTVQQYRFLWIWLYCNKSCSCLMRILISNLKNELATKYFCLWSNVWQCFNLFKGTVLVNFSEHPFQGDINHESNLQVFMGLTVVHTAHLDASLGEGVGWLEAYMVSWERFLGADPTLLFSYALLVFPRHSFSPFPTFFLKI